MVFQLTGNHIIKSLLALTLVVYSLPLNQSMATTIKALTLGQLSRLSGRIVQGYVTSKQVIELEKGEMWTRYTIYVEEVWKGDQRLLGQSFDLTLQGGELGHGVTHRGQVIHGQVKLEQGDKGILFLERSAAGHWIFTGMSQGWFKVVKQAAEEWAVREIDEQHLHQVIHAQTFAQVRGDRHRIPLTSLKRRILTGVAQPPPFKGQRTQVIVHPVSSSGVQP